MKLENTVAGDLVGIVHVGAWRRSIAGPFKVERVTKTRVMVRGQAFNRGTGNEVGNGSWQTQKCQPWTDDLADEKANIQAVQKSEKLCRGLSEKLLRARGEEALRLSGMISDELKEEAAK